MSTSLEFTREKLIAKAKEQIEFCRNTKITGEGRAHVDQCRELFEIALASLNGDPTGYCQHDGATYYDMSGRERCGMCGSDM